MRPPFWRYGLHFDTGQDDLWPEIYCISKGGQWTENGQTFGLGMFEHMMNARKIIWPNRYRHRWTDLLYKEFIQNDLTCLLGGASTGKTSSAVEFALLKYWARPDDTLVILSTVNLDKLDVGCFAELRMLWKQGKDRFPWLAGNLLEHKRAISTENLSESTIRDLRKGVVSRACYVGGRWQGLGVLAGLKQQNIIYFADECFPSGTLVDTPQGPRPIETIVPGDFVVSAVGPRRVKARRLSRSESLVRITTQDGRVIVCTPNHRFFTNRGWECAVDLDSNIRLFSPDETMQILRRANPSSRKHSILQSWLLDKMETETMPNMRKAVYSDTNRRHLLLKALCDDGAHEPSGVRCEAVRENRSDEARSGHQSHYYVQLAGAREAKAENEAHVGAVPQATEGTGDYPFSRTTNADSGRTDIWRILSRSQTELCSSHRRVQQEAPDAPVSYRFRVAIDKAQCGTGRRVPRNQRATTKRQIARPVSHGTWVDSVENIKSRGFEGFDHGTESCLVYNLQVEGHHSYSVSGLVCSNCQFMQEAFSASWPHLFSNGHVKIIASGNPKHDPDDELGKTAEPKDGWANHPEPQKTEVWDTKFMGGRCINLVGTDSPNFDPPYDRFPCLIGRKFASRIEHDYGKESFEYYRLVKGVMKVAFAHSRVITRQLCREHRASDKAEWRDTVQKRVYWLDPSYGGEDACAGGCLEWGASIDDTTIIRLVGYRLYRFNLQSAREVEDQIADILAEELNVYGVESTDAFYDSTGKGTLGGAFARKFGAKAPVPVDSGSQPSRRPVRQDLYVDENDGSKRLKRCDEHYSKFISELWFSVRYCIEANQMRELPDDFITEGCARIYEIVAGNKIAVEAKSDPKKKEDLKRRLGHSPNYFDGLAIGIEGARQRGFQIANLGTVQESEADDDYFEKEAAKYQQVIQSKLLARA